jgi:hypothetical protein
MRPLLHGALDLQPLRVWMVTILSSAAGMSMQSRVSTIRVARSLPSREDTMAQQPVKESLVRALAIEDSGIENSVPICWSDRNRPASSVATRTALLNLTLQGTTKMPGLSPALQPWDVSHRVGGADFVGADEVHASLPCRLLPRNNRLGMFAKEN